MSDEPTSAVPAEAAAAATTNEAIEPSETNGDGAHKKEDDESGLDKTVAEDAPAVEGKSAEADTQEATDATPASKDKKRKSTGGVPEHKGKKLNKKKSMPNLHLNCKPGEFYWARLKGYPPWPSVICDESMLPESLLATRPVSTARPDGTIRPDFEEGGKNAKERTFPIMFLSTNEFQWMVNTNLTPLDPEECKNASKSKMTKALQNAYEIASENHDLQYFKDILVQWQEENEAFAKAEAAAQAEAERVAAEKALAASEEKTKKKGSRKSKGAGEDEDMDDVEAPKSSKKRKKDVESDADAPKAKKTPKVTKINAPKTPNGEDSTKKAKPKKKVVSAPKAGDEDEPAVEMTEAERRALRFKTILYLRHRLQRGFLNRDKAPEESEMDEMNKHLSSLEGHQDLEADIIKETKIHKVLKGIVKLAFVPRDDEFQFKKRSSALLEVWNQRIEAAGDVPTKTINGADEDKPAETNGDAPTATVHEPTNGVKADEKMSEETTVSGENKIEEKAEEVEKNLEEKAAATAPLDEPVVKSVEADGDVAMTT